MTVQAKSAFPFNVFIGADGKPKPVLVDEVTQGLSVAIVSGAGGGGPDVELVPLATITVAALAPVRAFTKLATTYAALLFAASAVGATQDLTFYIDVSADGVTPEASNQMSFAVLAGGANSIEISGVTARQWFRVEAKSADGSSQPAQWTWLAAPR